MGHATLIRRAKAAPRWVAQRLKRAIGNAEQPKMWVLALMMGVLAGYAAVGFVLTLELLNEALYGASDKNLAKAARELPAWMLVTIPVVGGVFVGALTRLSGGATSAGVAEVIETRALGDACIEPKRGGASVLAAAISLGFGASAGREGPAVVAGATIASLAARRMKLSGTAARTLLGCAVAAAVSASFNAPIAGALFALEVVLGHYAVRAFAPITIASVAGAVISRSHLGDAPAFDLPEVAFGSYSQFPAFFLLGLVSAFVAVAMIWAIFTAHDITQRVAAALRLPDWSLPPIAGLSIGLIAVYFPHTISVGYQTTSMALAGEFTLWTCILLAIAKAVAVSISIGGRFAGGVFSPAIMLGALTGCAFGSIAVTVFPSVSGSLALYALAGMGAVSGAVLGAPISTTLIAFELTGDYGTAIAVMVSTSVATVAAQQWMHKSYFHWQLYRRGLDLSAGPQTFLLPSLLVSASMRPRGAENAASDIAAWHLVEQGVQVSPRDNLAKALPMFKQGQLSFLPVVDARAEGQGRTLIGALFYVDALRAYNRALVEVHEEEHS